MDEDEAMTSGDVSVSSETEDSEPQTELMVTSRARRITAGNRYSNLVAQEQTAEDEEDEVALLFAEGDEEDEEFQSDEGADDADMSSSDDDDQGPNVGGGELEGEKEILKEAKAEKVKKRKADMALTSIAGIKKKARIDPTALRRAAVPKPSKRKERVSWLPDQGATSGRTSLRAQTIAHREETHAKLKVNEEQRLRMKAIREKREREREAEAPKEMTQADRLAEAERIERKNAKSLNRWEAMEKKRAEEQAARLAALKERKLEGAVITLYSSSAKYTGLKGDRDVPGEVTELKKRGRKSKAFHEQMAAARLIEDAQGQRSVSASTEACQTPSSTIVVQPQPSDTARLQVTFATPQGPEHFVLTGIQEYASMPADASDPNTIVTNEVTTKEPLLAEQHELKTEIATPMFSETVHLAVPSASPMKETGPSPSPNDEEIRTTREEPDTEMAHPPGDAHVTVQDQPTVSESTLQAFTQPELEITKNPDSSLNPDSIPQATPPAPAIEVVSTRNLVILDKFDSLSSQTRNDFNLFYNNRKTPKPAKHTPDLCPITGSPVRYRDPDSGIGYATAAAYKKLQELKKHRFTWSSMLGCYAGRPTIVARGVPEGFLGP